MQRQICQGSIAGLFCLLTINACGTRDTLRPTSSPGELTQAAWTDGSFESDANNAAPANGWVVNSNVNTQGFTGSLAAPPPSTAALGLGAGGVAQTRALAGAGGASLANADPDLGTGQTFRFPRFGANAALVNYGGASSNGNNRNVNTLSQVANVTFDDVDASDNRIHVRFAVAPVLEYVGESYDQQPYYFVQLTNLSSGTVVYSNFVTPGAPNLPWRTTTGVSTSNLTQWLDWTLVDISPDASVLSVGNQVQLSVTAAGSGSGVRFGRLYVDGVGSVVPGPFVAAAAPTRASPGSNLTYTLNYQNGNPNTFYGTAVTFNVPANANFVATSLGSACTTPTVGTSGAVTCPIGTLGSRSYGSFTVTVSTASNANQVVASAYGIQASGYPSLTGPAVTTALDQNALTYIDVAVASPAPIAPINWGGSATFTVQVQNNNQTKAISAGTVSVDYPQSPNVSSQSWTCTPANLCMKQSGSGALHDTPQIPANSNVLYTVTVSTPSAGTGTVLNSNAFTATVVANAVDNVPSNNTKSIVLQLGASNTLTVNASGGAGRVRSQPNGIDCTGTCNANFSLNSNVTLTAIPNSGATFNGWTGACTGTSTTCIVSMTQAQQANATFTPPATSGTANALVYLNGSGQNAVTSSAFNNALSVMVVDANQTPVPNASVTFTVPASGASATLGTAVVTSNSSGVASTTVTANATSGSYIVTASLRSSTASFTLTNVGTASSITYVSGGTQASPQLVPVGSALSVPMIAIVKDNSGNPVPFVSVTFTPVSLTGATLVSSTSATTDKNGYVTLYGVANTTAGAYHINAGVFNASGIALIAQFYITNTAAAPALLSLRSGNNQTAALTKAFSQNLSVSVADANGVGLGSQSVTFTVVPNGSVTGTVGSAAATATVSTDTTGIANINATAGSTSGSFSVRAQAAGLSETVLFSLANNGNNYLTVSSGAPQATTLNTQFGLPLVAKLTDLSGAGISGATITFSKPATGASATLSSNSNTTDASGLASVISTSNGTVGSYQIVATTNATPNSAYFNLTNQAGAPAHINILSGASQTTSVNTSFSPIVVQVTDAGNTNVASANVTFVSNGIEAQAIFPNSGVATTDGNGVAKITPTANSLAGSYGIKISTGAISATSTFTNMSSNSQALSATSGDSQTTTVYTSYANPLIATLVDASQQAVVGATVYFVTENSSGPTLSAATAITAADGTAKVSATAGKVAGDYNVIAYTSGGASTQYLLHATPDVVFTLTRDQNAQGLATKVSTPFPPPLGLTAYDKWSNPLPNVVIDYTVPTAGPSATLSANQASTDQNGHVQVNATATSLPGDYTVQAKVDGASSPVTAFSLSNTLTTPNQVSAASGGGQETAVQNAFTAPLVVQVLNSSSQPVSNQLVRFSVPQSGASVTLSTLAGLTDSTGTVTVTATANNTAGSYQVTASVIGAAGAAVFKLINDPLAPSAVVASSASTPQTAKSGTPFAKPLTVAVQDALGNGIPGVRIDWGTPNSGGSANLSALSTVTDNTGTCSVNATANATNGSYSVTANANTGSFMLFGNLSPATFALTNSATSPPSVTLVKGSSQGIPLGGSPNTPITLQLLDPNGLPLQNTNITTPIIGGLPAGFSFSPSDQNGIVTLLGNVNNLVGDHNLIINLPGGLSPLSLPLSILPGLPALFVLSDLASPQTALLHHQFSQPLNVTIKDSLGNSIPGLTLLLSAPLVEPTCTLSSTLLSTDLLGIAEVYAVAGSTVGTYNVTALLSGVNLDPTAGLSLNSNFTLTNMTNVPNTITATYGMGQSTMAYSQYANVVVYTVNDALGYPAGGIAVTLASMPSGLVYDTNTLTSDANGQVATWVTAGKKTGTYNLVATAADAAAPANAALIVEKIPTKTTIQDTNRRVLLGTPSALAATVVAKVNTAQGNVTFTVDGNNVGTAVLNPNSWATLPVNEQILGNHNVIATFVPVDPFEASQSATGTFTVYNNWKAVGNGCTSLPSEALLVVGAAFAALVRRRRR